MPAARGELLCTWARDHELRGVGVDISSNFIAAAKDRASELGVSQQVRFEHADASEWVCDEPVDIASCLGATWIGDGVPGTVALLQRSLKPRGIMLIGQPFWLATPPIEALAASGAESESTWKYLPEQVEEF